MPVTYKIELITLIADESQNGFALFSCWDSNLVCRFMNGPGLNPADFIGKTHLSEFLGSFYAEALPCVNEAIKGKIQTRQQQFTGPYLEKTVNITFIPRYSDGIIDGIYLYVADTKEIPEPSSTNGDKGENIAVAPAHDHLEEVATTLRVSILSGFPGIAELSKRHFISASKLKRDFKNKYHETPFAYYRQLQMEYAHRYISQGIYNKKQMALMLNFANPSNFSSVYRNYLSRNRRSMPLIEVTTYEIYKHFIEHAPVAMALLDADLEFLAASELWMDKFRLPAAKLTGRYIYDALPEINPAVKTGIQACVDSMNEHHNPFSIKIDDKTAQWKIWSFVSPPGSVPDVKGILIITDESWQPLSVHNRKDRSHEIHYKAHDLLRIGSWTRDMINGTTYWSPTLKEMLEVPEDFAPDLQTAMDFYKEGPSREKGTERNHKIWHAV